MAQIGMPMTDTPTDGLDLEALAALCEAATPIDEDTVICGYEHGGGRVYQETHGEGRQLIADFYDRDNRECWIAARKALPALIATIRARDEDLAKARWYAEELEANFDDMVRQRDAALARVAELEAIIRGLTKDNPNALIEVMKLAGQPADAEE